MNNSKSQKLWFLLNRIERNDQVDLLADKAKYPFFYLLNWNEPSNLFERRKIALQSSQRNLYFYSIDGMPPKLEESQATLPTPAEEIQALQESIIDQFILNQPSLTKPKRVQEENEEVENLATLEFTLPVSETIAILLTKQGKYLQAIELYDKLSLIKPEKRLYFATRITELQNLLKQ